MPIWKKASGNSLRSCLIPILNTSDRALIIASLFSEIELPCLLIHLTSPLRNLAPQRGLPTLVDNADPANPSDFTGLQNVFRAPIVAPKR